MSKKPYFECIFIEELKLIAKFYLFLILCLVKWIYLQNSLFYIKTPRLRVHIDIKYHLIPFSPFYRTLTSEKQIFIIFYIDCFYAICKGVKVASNRVVPYRVSNVKRKDIIVCMFNEKEEIKAFIKVILFRYLASSSISIDNLHI